ncbi:MucB/RseB C-terminal domain-containing protein [Denitratisoma sp. agr-D3]
MSGRWPRMIGKGCWGRALLASFCSSLLPATVEAEPAVPPAAVSGMPATADALQWLQRVNGSASKLNYSGVFVYRSGNNTETSRIAHAADGNRELERIEVLDGSPREVIRENDETKCYLSESRLVVVEKRSNRRSFPALLPEGLGGLTDYYQFRKGTPARVAGYEAQLIVVEPRDDLRYSRQYWIENNTGLLLKAVLLNDKGETRESFAFTELKIGGPVDKEALRGHLKATGADWRVHTVKTTETGAEGIAWGLRAPVPGFRLVSGMKRQNRADGPETSHLVFTDGLAAISVFIEPASPVKRSEVTSFSMGAVNVYRRALGDYQLMAMGDVPLNTLKRLVDAIEPKGTK